MTVSAEFPTDQETILNDYYKKCDFSFTDSAKFEKLYAPKVKAYLEKLDQNQPQELRLPKTLLPESLDSSVDAIKLLYDSAALTKEEIEITDSSAVEIVKNIASKKWTSVEVYKAFAHRAVIGNQLANFANEFFLDEGLKKAEFLDSYLAEHGKTIGPLHGLPISIKEHLEYGGKTTHAGFVCNIENVEEESCPTLEIFEKLGAIYYVRTSQPQTIMHLDTNNNITGRTRNPNNLALSPGGSSGGEGACVSFGGSPIGIGTDIGGSIRCPAAFCGTFGLKPTSRRMSLGLVKNAMGFPESVVATSGPLSRNPADLDLFMKTYINEGEPWMLDPWALRIPWKKVEVPSAASLKIGILWDDEIVRPFPPMERGLKYTVDRLKEAGAKIVDFKPHRCQEAYDVVHAMYTLDGNQGERISMGESGEPLLPLTKWFMTYGDGDREYSISETHSLVGQRNSLRHDYLKLMNDMDIDFIISPSSYNVAAIPDKVHYWGYTSLWNILDMPTAVFPTGLRQDPEIDTFSEEIKPRTILEALELPNYKDPSVFNNAPISLQLTGRRYFDEETVAAVQAIAKVLEV